MSFPQISPAQENAELLVVAGFADQKARGAILSTQKNLEDQYFREGIDLGKGCCEMLFLGLKRAPNCIGTKWSIYDLDNHCSLKLSGFLGVRGINKQIV